MTQARGFGLNMAPMPRAFRAARLSLKKAWRNFALPCSLIFPRAMQRPRKSPLSPVPGTLPSLEHVNRLMDQAGKAGEGQPEARAAFEALVMLTGHLRDRKLDPVKLMAEVMP
jgi:hypothetical protein